MGFDSGVLEPGTVFGRDFKILRALKSGGMGAVYIVEQLSTGKQRALKVMNPDLAQDPATRERFVLEARAASQIDSDHVVEVVTAGVDEETSAPYLVMELLRGEELHDAFLRLGALPVGDVAEVLSQVGHALERAHAMGIVHRDLKPQNIFLAASRRKDASFTAKILDFGIAKLVADSAEDAHAAARQPALHVARADGLEGAHLARDGRVGARPHHVQAAHRPRLLARGAEPPDAPPRDRRRPDPVRLGAREGARRGGAAARGVRRVVREVREPRHRRAVPRWRSVRARVRRSRGARRARRQCSPSSPRPR